MKLRAVTITQFFFYLLATLWPMVGVNYLGQSDGRFTFYIFAGLMFANTIVFIVLGMNITKKPAYWLGVADLAACILLAIFDQFGLADLIALILFFVPLVIMLVKRNEFLSETQ